MTLALMNTQYLFSVCLPTDSEIEDFLSRCDFDITCEIAEEMMIEFYITFPQFYDRYQAKHLQKYGCKLPLRIKLPLTLQN